MTRPALAAGLLAANLIVFSFFDHFRGDFRLPLALAVIGCCAWLSVVAWRAQRARWLLLFVPIALLWNPVVAAPLDAGEWFVVYALAVLGLVCAAFRIHPDVRGVATT